MGGGVGNLCMAFDKISMNPTWFFSPNPELSISVRTILTQTLVSSPKSQSGCRSSLELASLVCHLRRHLPHFRPTLFTFTFSLTTTHWEASPLTSLHLTKPLHPASHKSPHQVLFPLTYHLHLLLTWLHRPQTIKAVQWTLTGSQLSIASVLQAAIKSYQMAPIQIFAVNLKEDWFIYHGGGVVVSFWMIHSSWSSL